MDLFGTAVAVVSLAVGVWGVWLTSLYGKRTCDLLLDLRRKGRDRRDGR
jgi:hypothetical protein